MAVVAALLLVTTMVKVEQIVGAVVSVAVADPRVVVEAVVVGARFTPYLLKDGQSMAEIMVIQEINQEQVVAVVEVEWVETLAEQGQELQMVEMVVQALVDGYLSTLYNYNYSDLGGRISTQLQILSVFDQQRVCRIE